MWRKTTHYKSATFAALVVASSITLLTGAQADTLSFGTNSAVFQGPPDSGTFWLLTQNTSSASLNGNVIGTARFVGPGGGSLARVSIGAFDSATSTFQVTDPNTSTLTVTSAGGATGDLLTGDLTVTSIQNSPTILMGNFTETSGSIALGDGTFELPVMSSDGRFPTVATALAAMGFAGPISVSFTPNALATITSAAPGEIPLPPAIYLFGSVLGGAFWLGRRKRSADSGLGSA